MPTVTVSPPRAPPIKYQAQHGTRWQREKEAAGHGAFEYPDDPRFIGPWIIGECVGKGASGRVKIAKHRWTGQLAAVKILPLQPLVNSRASLATQQASTNKLRLGVDREITMMKLMDHPNIIRIYDVFEGDTDLYLVLEYVKGGELFDFLVNRGKLHSLEALSFFKQIIYGLNYAHTFFIIHRDLKPENILIHSLNPPLIKIADWGMAALAAPALQLETFCGSPHYASPEIVNGKKYEGNATDVWSCGVILYALLTGRLPFNDEKVPDVISKVKAGKYEMPGSIDPQAQDLLARMLVVDVTKRITIPEILAHSWFQNVTLGIIYVPAPPVSELARPLPSAAHIDRDLLESLRIIWGRYANPNAIKADLLSPAGEGTLVKAFYFLLHQYRERTLRDHECVMDLVASCPTSHLRRECDESRKVVTKQYTSPHSPPPRSNQLEVGTHIRGYIHSGRNAPAPPPSRSPSPSPDPGLAPPLMKPNSRLRPPSPFGPRAQRPRPQSTSHSSAAPAGASHMYRGPTHYLPPIENKARHSRMSRSPSPSGYQNPHPNSNPHYVDVNANLRMQRPTHGQQACVADSPRDVSSVRFPVTSTHPQHPFPFPPPVMGERRVEILPKSLPVAPPNMHIYTPTPLTPFVTRQAPMPMLTAPKMENVAVQRTIDDITERVNVLVARGNAEQAFHSSGNAMGHFSAQAHDQWQNQGLFPPTAGSHGYPYPISTPMPLHPPGDLRYERLGNGSVADKENMVDNVREGLGLGKFHIKPGVDSEQTREVVYAVESRVGGEMSMKERKEKKNRPTTLNLPPLSTKRSTLSVLTSPTVTSPPALFSPVVGEFKGWFSNLFHWKAQSYVLYSPDDVPTTRSETIRLLQQFGVNVAFEDGDGYPLLRCRVDDAMDMATGSIIQKRTNFRVEFVSAPDTGNGTVPPQLRQPGALSSPRQSHGGFSPNPNSARASIMLNKSMAKRPGYLCAIVMVQEKGSMTTFRGVSRRLREEWHLSGLQSPTVGSGGTTPLLEHAHRFT